MRQHGLLTLVSLATVSILLVFHVMRVQATESPTRAEITNRLAGWNEHAFLCGRPEGTPADVSWKPFPSKVEPGKDPSSIPDDTKGCDDRDSMIFGGMLCLAGDERGCEQVRMSQDKDGRWWRSPRQRALRPKEMDVMQGGVLQILTKYDYDIDAIEEEQKEFPTTFSHDQALGVFAYLVATRDADAFRRWVDWIQKSPKCEILCPTGRGSPRFCLQDACAFKPADCPQFQVIGQYLNVPVPFCVDGPLPVTNEKLVEEGLGKLEKRISNAVPSALAKTPNYADAKDRFYKLYRRVLKQARDLDRKIATYSPTRFAALNTISQNLIASNRDPDEYHTVHNILLWILLLERIGQSDTDLHNLAVTRADAHKENPFFEFVAYRKSLPNNHLEHSILKACPATTEVRGDHRRTEWTWERRPGHAAWKYSPHRSMYWDCIFIAKLSAPESTLPTSLPQNPIPQRILEAKLALDDLIRLTIAAGDLVLELTAPRNNIIPPDQVEDTTKAARDFLVRKEPSAHRKAREKARKYLGF